MPGTRDTVSILVNTHREASYGRSYFACSDIRLARIDSYLCILCALCTWVVGNNEDLVV